MLSASAGSASAASGYRVTYAARVCPSYGDIYANRARNDIQESLKDLGPDSQYTTGGFLVNPDAESQPPQNKCEPLVGWQFTLGTGYQTRAVTGPWGSLSKVTSPYSTSIQTKTSTPLLNTNGDQIGNDTLAGAVTVELTDAQVQQAAKGSLWLQGGTPTDPVLAGPFPGPQYEFGAVRCATDALNGDNVEYIFFPSEVKHVFCYGLYVSPPPTSGTITIKKRVSGAPAGTNPAFPFNGNLSFDPGGFQLSDGQSKDFFRAGGASWEVAESPVDGYTLSSVECSATTQGPGPPASRWTVHGATTTINLVAGEHVTCVYNNRFVPPAGGLTITKITRGGTGTFGYVVTGGGETTHASATTTDPNVPADASPSPLSLAPGTYTIAERRPTSPNGSWRLLLVRCNGEIVTSRPVQVEVRSGEASVCTFVNAFIPRGSISISKVTTGGTGATEFLINPHAGTPTQFRQVATTKTEGVPAKAEPATAADATDHLGLGSYTIVEQSPAASAAGKWTLASVNCNGVVQPFDQGAVTVRLTRKAPTAHCRFTNVYDPHPPPDPPPVVPPIPPGGGPSPDVVYPTTDLEVTKHASPSTVVLGHVVTYRITVRNIGKVTAQRVEATDQTRARGKILSIHNPAGSCRLRPQAVCQLGNLRPGATVVITVRAIPAVVGARFLNRVAIGSATDETKLANNVADATVRVLPLTPPSPPSGLGGLGGLG